MKYFFIVNPASRSGQGKEVWLDIRRTLDGRKIPFQVFFTQYEGHGTRLVRQIAGQLPGCRLVVVGGDGTLNEVLNGLAGISQVTLGYIPLGSGNDFARGLGLPTDPQRALACILSPSRILSLDLGQVTSHGRTSFFGISAGLGYDAEICYQVSHSPVKKLLNRLHLGNLIYALVAVRLLLTYPPCDMEITVDGQRRNFQKVHFVTGMNLPYEGGGFRFCPDARPDDGRLSCMVVHGMNPLKILFLFPTAYFGKHTGFRGITLLEGKSIQIRSASPCKIHRDGEFGGVSDQVVFRAGDGDVSLIVG